MYIQQLPTPAARTTSTNHSPNATTVLAGLVIAIILFIVTSIALIWYLIRIRREDTSGIPPSQKPVTLWRRNVEPVEDIRSPRYQPNLILGQEFQRPESAHCRSPVSPLSAVDEKLEHRWWSTQQQMSQYRALNLEDERSRGVVVQL